MIRATLDAKIDDLFRYRKFPELLALVDQDYDQSALIVQLKDLQYAIYELDHYLETNWETDASALEVYWDTINHQLRLCGVEEQLLEDYGHQIRMYQKHELGMREEIMPYDHDIAFYYFYKSCDVKLLRRLIYDHFPKLEEHYPLTSWKLFDFITELNDDIEDVFEDCHTINGNGFLLGAIDKGLQVTQNHFVDFLEDIQRENRLLFLEHHNEMLYRWNEQEWQQTSSLLQTNVEQIIKGQEIYSPVKVHLLGERSMAS